MPWRCLNRWDDSFVTQIVSIEADPAGKQNYLRVLDNAKFIFAKSVFKFRCRVLGVICSIFSVR